MMKLTNIAALALCTALAAGKLSGQTPATNPAATAPAPEPPQVKAVRQAVAKAVAELQKDLQSSDPAKREAAARALRAISESVMAEILAQANLGESAVSNRMTRLMGELKLSAAAGEMLLSVPAEERPAMIDVAQRKPATFNSLFSDNEDTVAGAVSELASDKAAGATVARWALTRRDWQVRYAAINATPSPAGRESYAAILMDRLQSLPPDQPNRSYGGDNYTSSFYQAVAGLQSRERQLLLQALVNMKDERVLPYLVKRVIDGAAYDSYYGRDTTSPMLAELKSKAVVVTLIDYISNDVEITSTSFGSGNERVSCRRGDTALWIILRQTEQDPNDYGFWDGSRHGYGSNNPYLGFDSDKSRSAARAKLRKWMEDHQKDYEGVERLPIGAAPAAAARPDLPPFVEKMAK